MNFKYPHILRESLDNSDHWHLTLMSYDTAFFSHWITCEENVNELQTIQFIDTNIICQKDIFKKGDMFPKLLGDLGRQAKHSCSKHLQLDQNIIFIIVAASVAIKGIHFHFLVLSTENIKFY